MYIKIINVYIAYESDYFPDGPRNHFKLKNKLFTMVIKQHLMYLIYEALASDLLEMISYLWWTTVIQKCLKMLTITLWYCVKDELLILMLKIISQKKG